MFNFFFFKNIYSFIINWYVITGYIFLYLLKLIYMYLKYNFYICIYINFINTFLINTSIYIIFDELALFIICCICLIIFCIILFSYDYLLFDITLFQCLFILYFFIISVFYYFCIFNFFFLLFLWECLSWLSIFLICLNTWKILNVKAATKTFIISKFSDVCFIILFILIYLLIESSNFLIFLNLIPFLFFFKINLILFKISYIFLFNIFLCLCIICKSAQFFFFIWLPDAMEAPTPCSALIHTSTLVVIGIYLCLRFFLIIKLCKSILFYYLIISLFTYIWTILIIINQRDFKKILAYSTINQISFLIYGLSLVLFYEIYIYILLHAIFKTFIFIYLGYLIIFFNHISNIYYWGGYFFYTFEIYILFFYYISNLTCLPITCGFYTKEIFINLFKNFIFINNYIFFFIILTFIFSNYYLFILFINLFFNFKNIFINYNFKFFTFYYFNYKLLNLTKTTTYLFYCFFFLINYFFYFFIFINKYFFYYNIIYFYNSIFFYNNLYLLLLKMINLYFFFFILNWIILF